MRLLCALCEMCLTDRRLVSKTTLVRDFWEDDELLAAPAEARASERAVASGKPVAVDELTSSTSRVVARPDGTFTAETATSPERVRKDGKWTDIDTTLVAAPDGGLAPRAAEDIRFSGGGTDEPLARMVPAGKEYAVSSPWALPEPEVDGSSAVYRSVLPDVDLAVQAHPDGFTYHLVVHSREAAADPALRKVTRLGPPGRCESAQHRPQERHCGEVDADSGRRGEGFQMEVDGSGDGQDGTSASAQFGPQRTGRQQRGQGRHRPYPDRKSVPGHHR